MAGKTVGERAIAKLGWRPRPGQAEAVSELIDAMKNRKGVIAFSAPTGAGKSGMSLAAARCLNFATVIAVPTIQLAEQWKKMLGVRQSIYGRQNYPCELGGTAADAPCIGGIPCLFKQSCAYLKARHECSKSIEFVTTHAFLLAATLAHDPIVQGRLTIIDESHLWEKTVEDALTPTDQERSLLLLYPTSGQIKSAIKEAAEANDRVRIQTLAKILKIALASERGILKNGTIDHGALLRLYPKVLLMSATVPDWQLALAGRTVRMGMEIPAKQRPIFVQPVGALTGDNCVAYAEAIATAIERISERHRGTGIVHTGNTRLAEAVANELRKRLDGRVITAFGKGRTEAIETARLGGDKIIVSPSMTMGVDFAAAKWQVVAKVPFPKKGNGSLEDAVTNFVQAYGRLVRSPEATGVTYVLDANFRLLEEHLPEHVRQAVFWMK